MKIIKAHKKISRLVTEQDLDRVYKESEEIYSMLNKKTGNFHSFYAIAHPQVEDKDPLRFFVLNNLTEEFRSWNVVVINPVIINHTKQEIDSKEGCATFSYMPENIVKRFHKIQVELNFLEFQKSIIDKEYKPTLGKRIKLDLSGKIAKVFQHEIDHLNAKYIYDII